MLGAQFVGDEVWPTITRVCRKAGPRWAAIAYLGDNAADLLPLRAGDVLVTNLDRETLLARSTSVKAVRDFVSRGVHVYPSPALHAKLLVTRDAAVVGSANASANSRDRLSEAVVVLDTKILVEQARAYVRRLAEYSDGEVDDDLLREAQRSWNEGRPRERGGSGEKAPTRGATFPRDRTAVMWTAHTRPVKYTATVQQALDSAVRSTRAARGPATKFRRDSVTFPNTDPTMRAGDIVVFLHTSRTGGRAKLWLGELLTDALPAGARNAYWVRHLARQDRIVLDEALARLGPAAARVLGGAPDEPHKVARRAVRDELLALWK